jgi:hypothetical protein
VLGETDAKRAVEAQKRYLTQTRSRVEQGEKGIDQGKFLKEVNVCWGRKVIRYVKKR